MKNKIITVTLTIIEIITFMIILNKIGYIEDHYSKDVKVTCVHNSIVYVKDDHGYTYSIYSIGYNVGDLVTIEICMNHTGDICDDTIEKAYKVGG